MTNPEQDEIDEVIETNGLDDEAEEAQNAEPLDVDALVRKARRSRQIAESDVQSILASVSDEQADQL